LTSSNFDVFTSAVISMWGPDGQPRYDLASRAWLEKLGTTVLGFDATEAKKRRAILLLLRMGKAECEKIVEFGEKWEIRANMKAAQREADEVDSASPGQSKSTPGRKRKGGKARSSLPTYDSRRKPKEHSHSHFPIHFFSTAFGGITGSEHAGYREDAFRRI